MPKPEDLRRIERAQRSALKRMGNIGSTRHPPPEEQKKLNQKLSEELRRNGDILGKPIH